jgi:hypothetical protein
MGRLLVSLALLLALTGATQATARDAAARKPVFATTASGLTYHVFRADPITLRPVAGGRSWASEGFMSVSRSPDGRWLAASSNNEGTLRFVRVATMRSEGSVTLGRRYMGLHPVAWLSRGLLVAWTGYYGAAGSIIGIDAASHHVVWRRSLEDKTTVIAGERAGDRLVLLLGRNASSAPARLLVVGANGAVRSIELDRMLVAASGNGADALRAPGLAVDASANRAYVVDADALVAQVDLGAMTVAYSGGSRTLAKVMPGRERQAIWLGAGMLAVTGSDSSTAEVSGVVQFTTTPAGLYLVNVQTGTARLLQRDAAAAKLVGGALVAYGVGYGSGSNKEIGSGVTIYGLDGTLRAHFFGATPVNDVRSQGGLAYVHLPDRTGHIAVIDAASGRVLRTISRPTLQVLAG